jgi:hypothetical protein
MFSVAATIPGICVISISHDRNNVNLIDAQREAGEKWRAINRRDLPAVQEEHAREKKRRELEETEPWSAESREQKGVIAIALSIRPTKQERQPTEGDRSGQWASNKQQHVLQQIRESPVELVACSLN